MSNPLNEKAGEMPAANIKEAPPPLVSDVKEIANEVKGSAVEHVQKSAQEGLHKVETKPS